MEILLAALTGGVVSAVVELVKFLRSRRQRSAETALTNAQTTLTEVQAQQALTELVDGLSVRLTQLSHELDEQNDKIRSHIPWDEHMAQRLATYEPVPVRPPL